MNNSRFVITNILAVVMVLFVAGGCSPKPEELIIGKWESETERLNRSEYDFLKDGTFTASVIHPPPFPPAVDSGKWSIDADKRLVITFLQNGEEIGGPYLFDISFPDSDKDTFVKVPWIPGHGNNINGTETYIRIGSPNTIDDKDEPKMAAASSGAPQAAIDATINSIQGNNLCYKNRCIEVEVLFTTSADLNKADKYNGVTARYHIGVDYLHPWGQEWGQNYDCYIVSLKNGIWDPNPTHAYNFRELKSNKVCFHESVASNKQKESTQSVSPTAVSSQKSASVTTSKVSEGLNLAGAAKLAVKETLEAIGNFPSVGNNPDANAAYGLPSPVSIVGTYTSSLAVLDSGVIRITYNENLGGDPSANGHTILVAPKVSNNKVVGWDCSGGTMPETYLPPECR